MGDLEQISTALLRGEVVVLPTDTVYGLCALPTVEGSLDRLFDAKGRGRDTPIAVLCATPDQALGLADDVSPTHRSVAQRVWPGPLTLVLNRKRALTWELGEPAHTIGLRVPDHALLHALTARLGPIAATSANRHGEPTARTPDDVRMHFGDVVMIVDGGALPDLASTVVDATAEPWQILRVGALVVDDLIALGAPI